MKIHARVYVLFSLLALIMIASCQNPDSSDSPSGPWLEKAIQAEGFIAQGQYESDQGWTWRTLPDSLEAMADYSLYSGVPGICLFYLELYHVTGDPSHLLTAEKGGAYLLRRIPDTIPPAEALGLYTGVAGIGYTLGELYRSTQQEQYLDGLQECLQILAASATPTSNGGIEWGGGINDIVYGAAGIGLFMEYAAAQLDIPEGDSLAILVGEGLLANAIDTAGMLRWRFMPEYERFMDNFSHGTAGVAYFLTRLNMRTGEKAYLEAALQATRLLDALADERGFIPHHYPGGEDLFYLSWCHGPAGIARLYSALFEATKDPIWEEELFAAAQNMLEEDLNPEAQPGFWKNAGKCCGTTSLAEYYLWLYQKSGESLYLNQALELTAQVIQNAQVEAGTMKWVHAEHRVLPDFVQAQSGLMQGSAGIGLWLLALEQHQAGKSPFVQLVDYQ